MRVLVTGATGFLGTEVCTVLRDRGHIVRRAIRGTGSSDEWEDVAVGSVDGATNWRLALDGIDAVIHLAARVHIMREERASDALAEHRRVNLAGTEKLARSAVEAGVGRMIFVSTIKVNGERSAPGTPFRATDPPRPSDPYAIAKYEAERALHAIAGASGLAIAVVRPPLVYGPGVKGNFRSVLRLVHRGLPVPIGAIRNRRSLVALHNLADLLCTLVESRAVRAGHVQTFLVSDGDDLSTPELFRRVARAMGRALWLPRIPVDALRAAGTLVHRRDIVDRLVDDLWIDMQPTTSALGWTPPCAVDTELARTVAWYLGR